MFARYLLTQATPSQCNQRSCFAISSAWIYSLQATDKWWMNNDSVGALWRLRRNLKFLIVQIILQSFQNWIQLNEFLERKSNSLSPFVTGPGINYRLYCCFLYCLGIKRASERWAADEVLPVLKWCYLCLDSFLMFDSAEVQMGKQRAGFLGLLNWTGCWIGCFPVNGVYIATKCLCKLYHICSGVIAFL